ncbi:MAG: ATP-binding cassette domain-containing protein, partial [Oscillospiraceae bacterium]|nr:ATP-binding cassette domain-containing protein [Oscillospiraceae bacterium]
MKDSNDGGADGALLRLEGIKKSFNGAPVLRGIDLSVRPGEFITLLGPSGCGKTTTIRIVAGFERPDAGRVWLDGQDVTDLAPNRRDVNTVFQNYALFPHMNVEANIAYSFKIRRRPKAQIREAVAAALETVRLEGFGRRMPHELS